MEREKKDVENENEIGFGNNFLKSFNSVSGTFMSHLNGFQFLFVLVKKRYAKKKD